jgi:hypothetical protein
MHSDPNFKQAVLQTGISMMKSPQVGQNGFDIAANALGTGVSTLQGLRESERQKLLQQQELDLKTRDVNSAIAGRTNSAENTTKNTQLNIDTTARQLGQKDTELEREQATLDEMIRSHKAQEEIDRQKVKVDNLRASAYARYSQGGGSTPADITKIENLTAQYVAGGMNEVEARAKATTEIQTTGKGKAPGDRYLTAAHNMTQAWLANPANIGKPLDEATQRNISNAAKMFAGEADALDAGRPMGVTPPAATPRTPAANPQAPGAALAPTDVTAMVARFKKKGITPEQIRQSLKNAGLNPQDYGY